MQFGTSIEKICTDHGVKFSLTQFLNSKGVMHQLSCVETPLQNSLVERKHQHFLNAARALMFQSHLPPCYCGDTILTTTHIINHLPTPLLGNKSSIELLFNTPPSYNHLCIFGCLCFAFSLHRYWFKFDPRACQCIFLGYPFGIKGYKLLDILTNKTFISRHVIFHEHLFP